MFRWRKFYESPSNKPPRSENRHDNEKATRDWSADIIFDRISGFRFTLGDPAGYTIKFDHSRGAS